MRLKRILALLLSTIIILSAFSVPSFAESVESNTITVNITVSKHGQFLTGKDNTTLINTPVTLTGKTSYTLDDLFIAVHDLYYDGGAALGYATSIGQYYGQYLTKVWGDTSGFFGYYVNQQMSMGPGDAVANGDFVELFINKNEYPNTENYATFDINTAALKVRESIELTLKNDVYDAFTNSMVLTKVEGAKITVNGEETDILTNAEGKATLSFTAPGKYIVSAKKSKTVQDIVMSAITAPVCIIEVTNPDNIQIIHNIAQKCSEEGVSNDVNTPWFVADLVSYITLYPQSTFVLSEAEKQACVDKIIANAYASNSPNVLASSIIALRALGYDAKNTRTSSLESFDIVNKLTMLVDQQAAIVTNIYNLSYVIIALQQGENYATEAQMNYLISTALSSKASWQSTEWGTDGATPMILALSPYYDTNNDVKTAIDETLPIVNALQSSDGLVCANAASTGLVIAAYSAIGIDSDLIVKDGNSLIDGLMTQATYELDAFNPTTNSFSTEQGLRGLIAYELYKNNTGKTIFDYSQNPMNAAYATWAQNCPVEFNVTPADATVTVTGQTPFSQNKYDLLAGTYSYTVSKSGYNTLTGTFTVSSDEAANHTEKVIPVSLSVNSGGGSGSSTSYIRITVKVMAHDEDECDNSYTYKNNKSKYKAIVSKTVKTEDKMSVLDALISVLEENDVDYTNEGGYISSINGISAFDHGANSGWMYTVGGKHVETGADETIIKSNSTVVWYYTDDYTKELGTDNSKGDDKKEEKTYYTVKFDTNGANDVKDETVEENKKVAEPSLLTKEGYVFDGWYADKDFTLKYDFSSKVTSNITLYAKWGKEVKFSDIENHENQKAIESLAREGIINGKSETVYDPDSTMTRAEFATIVVNGLGINSSENSAFSDVTENDWFYNYINTAVHYGIVKGVNDKNFDPEGTVTLEQALTMITRAAKLCGLNTKMDDTMVLIVLSPFADYKNVSEWASESVAFCYNSNIISDDELTINPQRTVDRAEIAQMIYNLLLKVDIIKE